MSYLDETHDCGLRSWVESANQRDSDFPIQNLPYGVFSTAASPSPRVGVAIGDQILDLSVLEEAGLLPRSPRVFFRASLNPFMSSGAEAWSETRRALSGFLARDNPRLRDDAATRFRAFVPQRDARLHLPIEVQGFTDFYASREHATNVGAMFRDPKNALLPNWLHMPVGYNARASTVVVSGTDVHRPMGQIMPQGAEAPVFGSCSKLDFELEVGAIVGSPSTMGHPVSVEQADAMIFGYVLLNDWSARDIQVWEYQPLGPFQSKAFATTISPWVVTQEALKPFRVAGPHQDPRPLAYLRQERPQNHDIHLRVSIQPEGVDDATTICRTNFKTMYWSSAQQLAHHTISGCAMRTGDLLGSGTISGPEKGSFGSLLELTWNGKEPLSLAGGVRRGFIEDGDTLTLTGWCQGDGYRVGFGAATGKILPAVASAARPI